jgi:hypothetical protein
MALPSLEKTPTTGGANPVAAQPGARKILAGEHVNPADVASKQNQTQRILGIITNLEQRLSNVTSVSTNVQMGVYKAFGNNTLTRGASQLGGFLGDTLDDLLMGKQEEKKEEKSPLLETNALLGAILTKMSESQTSIGKNGVDIIPPADLEKDSPRRLRKSDVEKKGTVGDSKVFDKILDVLTSSNVSLKSIDKSVLDIASNLPKLTTPDDNDDSPDGIEKKHTMSFYKYVTKVLGDSFNVLKRIDDNTKGKISDQEDIIETELNRKKSGISSPKNGDTTVPKDNLGDSNNESPSSGLGLGALGLASLFGIVMANLKSFGTMIADVTKSIGKHIVDFGISLYEKAKSLGASAWESIKGLGKKVWEKGSGLVDDVVEGASKVGKKAGELVGKAATGMSEVAAASGKVASRFAKFIPGVGAVITAGMAGYDAIEGANDAKEYFDLKNRDATTGEKVSGALGNVVSGLSMGFVDKVESAKFFKSINDTIFGKEEDKAKELVERDQELSNLERIRKAVEKQPTDQGSYNQITTNNVSNQTVIAMRQVVRNQDISFNRYLDSGNSWA